MKRIFLILILVLLAAGAHAAIFVKDSTSQSIIVTIYDTSGSRLTGLAYDTSSLVAAYTRTGAATTTFSLVTQTAAGAWTSGGFVEVDATSAPGDYRLDIPDAVLATGVNHAKVTLSGAATMLPYSLSAQLVTANLQAALGLESTLTAMKGATFDTATDSLQSIRDRGDFAWLTGSGATSNLAYPLTTLTRTVGDADSDADTSLTTVDGSYYTTGEIATTTLLEVDIDFTLGLTDHPSEVHVWGFYSGNAFHVIEVQALVGGTANYEVIGIIPLESSVQHYSFGLTSQHANHSTGIVSIKFVHSAGSGNTSHYLALDKVIVGAQSAQTTGAQYADAIFNALIASYGTSGTYGELIESLALEATVEAVATAVAALPTPVSASVQAAADWAYTTRTLTGVGSSGLALEATVGALPTPISTAVMTAATWAYTTRTLTSAGAGGATADEIDALLTINHGSGSWLRDSGSGLITVTYTVTSTVSPYPPISGVTVWVTTDLAGTNTIATSTTNTFGVATFHLVAGTYYVWRSKANVTFTNPITKEVSL